MSIEIQTDRDAWDHFITESPYGSIFHRWDLLKIVEKHTGFRFHPYGITKGTELIALLPLFSRRVHGIRIVASPPPRTGIPRMGLVVPGSFDRLKQDRKEQNLEIIGTEMAGELEILDPDHFLISLPLHFHDVRIFQWLGFAAMPRYTYLYDISRPLDQLWEELKGNKRTRIRNAERNGYTLRRGGMVSDFYRLMEIRAREVGLSLALPGVEYLADLLRCLPEQLKVYEIFHRGRVIGSAMATLDRDMKMWLGTPKTVPNANDFLQWSLIREAKELNFSTIEDVGANTWHLTRFKNQFNPSLAMYYTITRRNFRGRMAEALYCTARTIGRGRRRGG